MSRIILVAPPWYRLFGGSFAEMPLGLCALAGYLNARGHEARVLNADFDPRVGMREFDQHEMFRAYPEYRRVLSEPGHAMWQETVRTIEAMHPDVLGMTAQVGSFGSVRMVASLFKQHNPDIPVVVGGPMASIAPEECLAAKAFDYVVHGEGEIPLAGLVEALRDGRDPATVPGLALRRDGIVVVTERPEPIQDLDSLPVPDREALMGVQDFPSEGLGMLFTARGCPFRCAYCAASSVWGRQVRFRSVPKILEEMTIVAERWGLRRFTFKDDTFTLRRDRTRELCRGMLRQLPGITWSCLTRADCVDEELVRLMARAGCRHVELGLESGCPEVLEKIGKGETVEQVGRAVGWFRRAGVATALNIIVGFPGETPEQMRQSRDAALRMRPSRILVSLLAPYPGTQISRELHKVEPERPEIPWEDYFHASAASQRLKNDPAFASTTSEIFAVVERYNRSSRRRMRDFARLALRHPGIAGQRMRRFVFGAPRQRNGGGR